MINIPAITSTDDLLASGNRNELNFGSFDENQELTLPVVMNHRESSQNLAVRVLSDDEDFQVKTKAELIIAFDRPVRLIHDVEMITDDLTTPDVRVDLTASGPLQITDKDGNPLTTAQGQNALAEDPTEGGIYKYTKDDASEGQLPIADADNKVGLAEDQTFAVAYGDKQIVTTLADTALTWSADNTVLKISVDPATLKAMQKYEFNIAVEGLRDDSIRATYNTALTALPDESISDLSALWLDDGDFKDTTQKNIKDATKDVYWPNQADHTDKLIALAGTTNGTAGAGALDAYLNWLDYDNLLFDFLIGGIEVEGSNTLFATPQTLPGINLISPAQLWGSVQIKSVTEEYLEDGEIVTETRDIGGAVMGLDYSSDSWIHDGPFNELPEFINGHLNYVLDKPGNHLVAQDGLNVVYGPTNVVSGIKGGNSGFYYSYGLPVAADYATKGGYIKSVTVNLDVVVNGIQHKGEVVLTVQ